MIHPRRKLSFVVLQASGWCGLYVLAVIASLPDLRARGVWPGITVFVGSLLAISLGLRLIYRRWWNAKRSWVEIVAVSSSASVVGAVVAASGPFRWLATEAPTNWSGWPFDATEAFVVLFLWSTLYFGVKVYVEVEATRERAILIESEARRARLSVLRAQLNPHFLFNALNGVSTLILEHDNARANAMLTQLSMLLRASLDDDGATEVALKQELALVDLYLGIERTRFEGQLQFETRVDDAVLAALVPAMVLQPLVENAVRHGVARSTAPVRIRLTAVAERGVLRIAVENPVFPHAHAPGGGGLGLSNTRERLRALYGADAALTTISIDGVFRAELSLPLRFSGSAAVACAS